MDYKEKIIHGKEGFPFAAYNITKKHIRYNMPFHWHPEHEIVYISEGELDIILNGFEYHAKPGDILFVSGGTFHSGIAHECIYDCFVFNLRLMVTEDNNCKEFVDQVNNGSILINQFLGHDHEELNKFVKDIKHSANKEEADYQFTITEYILKFIEYIMEYKLYTCDKCKSPRAEKDSFAVKNILNYIEKNYSQIITLAQLADVANMSPNYFCRYFKRIAKQTPIDYLISYRLNMAAYKLIKTNNSVSDIALSCGFNDVSNFIKSFKTENGVTPKQYRESYPNELLNY